MAGNHQRPLALWQQLTIIAIAILAAQSMYVFELWSQDLPNISAAINQHLLSKSSAEISKALSQEKKLARRVRQQLKSLLSASNKEQRPSLEGALRTLNNLPFQYARLEAELKRVPEIYHGEQLSKGPSNLKELKVFLLQLFKAQGQRRELQTRQKKLQTRLSLLKEDLDQLFITYSQTKTKGMTEGAFSALAQLLSLRPEYAVTAIQGRNTEQAITQLSTLISSAQKTLQKSFKTLYSTKEELQGFQNQLSAQKKTIKQELRSIRKQLLATNKKILYYELQIDTTSQKIKASSKAGALLKAEQQRLMARLNELLVKKRGLEQEKVRLKVISKESEFWPDCASLLQQPLDSKKIATALSRWKKELASLDDLKAGLKDNLDQIKELHSQIVQKMALLSNEKNQTQGKILLQALRNYYQQLKRSEQTVSKQVIRGIEIKTSLEQLIFIQKTCRVLLQERTSVYQRVQTWSKVRVAQLLQKIKTIIFYPLFTLGRQDISLGTIFKILTFLCLGLIALRTTRKKIKNFLQQNTELSLGTINSITTLGYYSSLVLVVLISLSTAGIDLSQLSIILGALGVGMGFGLQTIANNFVSGLILLTDRSIKVGDFVELDNGLAGQVQDVAIRATVIRTFAGEDVIVPNSEFVSGKVHTWTYTDDWRRLKIPFGVSYTADPEEVERIAITAARTVGSTQEDQTHPIKVFFEGFGDNSLDFSLRVWCRMNNINTRSGLFSDYYFALFKGLKEAGIEIPFPQRDLNLRSISKEALQILQEMALK